jgi:O-antigen/teichoic acid export membrane protein
MGIIIRQSFKSTLISYIGIAIGIINVLWLMPEFFSPEQVGLFRLLQDIPVLIASFMQFGAATLADRFFPRFKTSDGRHNGFLFLLLVYPFLGYLLFLLSSWIFNNDIIAIYQEKSPLFTDYMMYLIPLSLFLMYSSVFETYARVNLRIVVPTLIREIILRVLFLMLIACYALQFYDFGITIILYVLSYGLALILLIIYTIATLHFYVQPHFDFLDKVLVKDVFSFLLIIIPGSVASLIASKIDTLMIGAVLGLKEIAIYNLAFFIGSIVDMPKRALSQISTPIISQAWNRNDLSEIEMIYKKSTINQALLGVLIFLMIWLNADILLAMVPKHEIYQQGKYVILFIALSRLLDMATGVNTEIITTSPYYRMNLLFIVVMAVLTISTNLLLIGTYGINGVAFAACISMLLFNIFKTTYIWYKLKMQPYDSSILKLIAVAFVVVGLFYFWPQQKGNLIESVFQIALRSIAVVVLFVSAVFYLEISIDFNHTLKNLTAIIKTFKPESNK